MRSDGVLRHTISTMIPICIRKRHVSPTCFTTNVADLERSPIFELSAEGKKELDELIMVGGNHRVAAVKQYAVAIKTQMEKAERNLAKGQNEEVSETRMASLRRKAVEAKDKWDAVGMWTVVLHDHGE